MRAPFAVLFARDLPFGRCVAVALPDGDAAVPGDPPGLLEAEAAYARALPVARRLTWVGGRLALRAALAHLGIAAPDPILSTARGAPRLPAGTVGSISHKRSMAVALAAHSGGGATVGVDVEIPRPFKHDVAARILGDEERARVDALDPDARAREVLVSFAAKEAIYKALDPWVARTVGFAEATISRDGGGRLRAAVSVPEGTFAVEIHEEPAPGLVLVAARVTRAPNQESLSPPSGERGG
jgi:4'-phosphopantetheinyl transferase EntD